MIFCAERKTVIYLWVFIVIFTVFSTDLCTRYCEIEILTTEQGRCLAPFYISLFLLLSLKIKYDIITKVSISFRLIMVGVYCSVNGCWEPYGGTGKKHRFPNPAKNLDLFNKWVFLCDNKQLRESHMTPERIYKNCRICHKHFDENDFIANDVLKNTAVPHLNLSGSLKDKENVSISELAIDLASQATIDVSSTSLAALDQPLTSQAAIDQPSTSQATINQPSTSQAAIYQPSTSQAADDQPSTSQSANDEPSTPPSKFKKN